MTKNSSFIDKERGERSRCETDGGNFSVSGDTCINCGAPLGRKIPEGYEGALCDACE
jgi:hypothetical protein